MTDAPESIIADAITEHWGERCKMFDPACHTCQAWQALDNLVSAIHAKAIAQAVEVIISHIDGRDYLATRADEAGDSSGASIHRHMLHALNEARVAIRALSPDPDLIVVRREQVEAWAEEWDMLINLFCLLAPSSDLEADRAMIAEMRALLSQPTGGEG